MCEPTRRVVAAVEPTPYGWQVALPGDRLWGGVACVGVLEQALTYWPNARIEQAGPARYELVVEGCA